MLIPTPNTASKAMLRLKECDVTQGNKAPIQPITAPVSGKALVTHLVIGKRICDASVCAAMHVCVCVCVIAHYKSVVESNH